MGEKISSQQFELLNSLLKQCPGYQTYLLKNIQGKYNLHKIEDLPASEYEKALRECQGAINHAAKRDGE